MKIQIHTPDGPNLTIPLPNALLFSPTLLRLALKWNPGRDGNPLLQIPPEALAQACRAIKDYTKRVGSWEMVHVETADGTRVIIII